VPADQSTNAVALLAALLERRELAPVEVRGLMDDLVGGHCGEPEAAALLIALRMKGETAAELAAAAEALHRHMIPLDAAGIDALDTSGTGGDGQGTFNISTTAALIAAGAGVPVVKHGNRAVSGKCGSADLLARLGVNIEAGPDWARRCLKEVGFAFCFAPHFHPALKNVAALRRRLGVRTIFNSLGPLLNPAATPFQLIGVGRPELLDLIAGALARRGRCRRAFLVWGRDGQDEVSLAGPTMVREVSGSAVRALEWTPCDFGLPEGSLEGLRVDCIDDSAALVRAILDGKDGPARHSALANAAAAIHVAGKAATLAEGVACAAEAIDSGRARKVLERLVAFRSA
jgi:anthranilate phosphoribosyltransferase